MGTTTIGLSSNLTFDSEYEKDIIQFVEELKSSHKIGQYISVLIRIAHDHPEIMNCCEDGSNMLEYVNSMGMSEVRYNDISNVRNELHKIDNSVSEIYKLALQTYTLGIYGKRIGLDKKAESELIAAFVAQKHIKDIENKTGIKIENNNELDELKEKIHSIAEDVIEEIITSYSELMEGVESCIKIAGTAQPVVNSVPIKQEVTTEIKVKKHEDIDDSTDEVVDFGAFNDDVDIEALSNFFGE